MSNCMTDIEIELVGEGGRREKSKKRRNTTEERAS